MSASAQSRNMVAMVTLCLAARVEELNCEIIYDVYRSYLQS